MTKYGGQMQPGSEFEAGLEGALFVSAGIDATEIIRMNQVVAF